jgi:hypothetical protein
MTAIDVIRHVIRPHQPVGDEEYDPSHDMLIVVHKNPNDPDDPTEWGHHIRLQGLSYRKEMWGLPDYASTIDMELRDLERYYARTPDEDYGVHPLATITGHYFEGPKERMKSFTPDYVFDRVQGKAGALPDTADGVARMCLDVVLSGVDDVKGCLASSQRKAFPCKGMTGLSSDTVKKRAETMSRMEEQTQRIDLVSSGPLDAVRQLLTDRESELEVARDTFVNHALVEASVPEIMRKRVVNAAVKRGLLEERMTWM